MTCSIDNCEKAVQARGLCPTHYMVDWRQRNPEKTKEAWGRSRRVRRQRDPLIYKSEYEARCANGWRERKNALIRKQRAEGRLVLTEATRQLRAEQQRRRRAAEPIKTKIAKLARRIGWTEESSAYATILLRDPCCYCGSKGRLTIDHIVPIAEGGSNDWTNLTAACKSCNSRKHTRQLLPFLLRTAA